MAVKKKTPAGDTTRTERAKAHLERLEKASGKRLLVNLDADGHALLQELCNAGIRGLDRLHAAIDQPGEGDAGACSRCDRVDHSFPCELS